MRKNILLAMLMVAVVAVPASASVQNIKVSGNIDSIWVSRTDFDLGVSLTADDEQNLFITQSSLRVDADLTDNVSATIALINERSWSADPGVGAGGGADDDSNINLNLAYVTLREMLYSPLTVVAGRQVFSYGNSFIIDATGANNAVPTDSGLNGVAHDLTMQTAQDAIRLIFDYNPLTVELLFSHIAENTETSAIESSDDIDLYGINTSYELGDDMETQVEAYFFAKIDKSTEQPGTPSSKSDTVYVPGLRASTNPIEGLNVQAELALQRGTKVSTTSGINADSQNRHAAAAQFIANYQVPVAEEYNPVANYTYTFVSGDNNPASITGNPDPSSTTTAEVFTQWDPMYEAQGGGTIYNTIFNLTNMHIHSVSLQANPMEDVTAKVTWSGLWQDKEQFVNPATNTAAGIVLVQPDGTAATANAKRNEDELGYEIDVDLAYDYTEDVQFGASFGWFVPGDIFLSNQVGGTNANDSIAKQAIIHGNVNF
jgi:hypothetical protein